jgi:hypothetical protein
MNNAPLHGRIDRLRAREAEASYVEHERRSGAGADRGVAKLIRR